MDQSFAAIIDVIRHDHGVGASLEYLFGADDTGGEDQSPTSGIPSHDDRFSVDDLGTDSDRDGGQWGLDVQEPNDGQIGLWIAGDDLESNAFGILEKREPLRLWQYMVIRKHVAFWMDDRPATRRDLVVADGSK